jgi:DNA repair exonuclease SbcCD ATPase subunit
MRRSFSYVFNGIKNQTRTTKIKDLRVSKTGRLSLSNYNSNFIKDKIIKIQQSINFYKTSNIKRSNELIQNTKKFFSKKTLILSLRGDLEYHKKVNDDYIAYERYTTDLCRCFKKNFEDIYIYKVSLTKELKDFIKLLNDYEEAKKELIKEKKLIIQSNDDIIKYKLEEQNKLNKEFTKLNEDLEKQNLTLKDLNNILKNSLTLNENNLKSLQNEELKYNEKLEKLENAYKKLISKFNYYEDVMNNERQKKYGDNEIKDKEEKNEANIKLKEETLKNNYLKKAIKDIQNKMKKIQVNNSNLIKHKSSGKIKSPKIISPKRRISSKANELTVTKFTESKGNYSSNMF